MPGLGSCQPLKQSTLPSWLRTLDWTLHHLTSREAESSAPLFVILRLSESLTLQCPRYSWGRCFLMLKFPHVTHKHFQKLDGPQPQHLSFSSRGSTPSSGCVVNLVLANLQGQSPGSGRPLGCQVVQLKFREGK